MEINLLTYNIHKGLSFFTRQNIVPEINNIIDSTNAEIVFLQEVQNFHHKQWKKLFLHQLEDLSIKHRASYGPNFFSKKSHHGNAILSIHQVLEEKNFNLSINRLERRGLLYNKLLINQQVIHSYCTHLNLLNNHRQQQLEKILFLLNQHGNDPVILAGDFNDFKRNIHDYLLKNNFYSLTVPTFPAISPLFAIDNIYVKNLKIIEAQAVYNTKTALSSDHLPLLVKIKI